MTQFNVAELTARKTQLSTELDKLTIDRAPDVVLDAIKAQIKDLEKRIVKMNGKSATTRDGVAVKVGDTVFKTQKASVYHDGSTVKARAPQIIGKPILSVSPTGMIALTKTYSYRQATGERYTYEDPKDFYGHRPQAVAAAVADIEYETKKASKDIGIKQAMHVAWQNFANDVSWSEPGNDKP